MKMTKVQVAISKRLFNLLVKEKIRCGKVTRISTEYHGIHTVAVIKEFFENELYVPIELAGMVDLWVITDAILLDYDKKGRRFIPDIRFDIVVLEAGYNLTGINSIVWEKTRYGSKVKVNGNIVDDQQYGQLDVLRNTIGISIKAFSHFVDVPIITVHEEYESEPDTCSLEEKYEAALDTINALQAENESMKFEIEQLKAENKSYSKLVKIMGNLIGTSA
jgi:hypothetical protein